MVDWIKGNCWASAEVCALPSAILVYSYFSLIFALNCWFSLYRHVKIIHIKQPDEGSLEDTGSLFKGPQVKKVGAADQDI